MKPSMESSVTPGGPAALAAGSSKRRRVPLAVGLVLVLGLGLGAAAYLGLGRSPSEEAGPATLVRNGLANGTYPYVVACEIFTGADVRAIEGRAGDPASVQGTYGVGFPRTAPEDKAFTSSCTRHPRQVEDGRLSSVYDVSIDQYPSTTMIQRLIKEPPKIGGSQIDVPGLADRFGAGAILNRNLLSKAAAAGESQFLTFYYQNKAVIVSITLPPDKKDLNLQAKVIKLGRRILRRLRSGVGTSGFVMGPASGRLAGSRYFSPCKLLTAPGVKAAFSDLAVDTTSIAFTYAEGATRNKLAEETSGSKVYDTLDGGCSYPVTGADGRKFTVELSTEQVFDNIALSSLIRSYRMDTTDEKIDGVGQAAKIGTFKADNNEKYDPALLIGYPYTLVTVQLGEFKGTDAQRKEYLKKIARQMPARLP
jgi:hypothetical protein